MQIAFSDLAGVSLPSLSIRCAQTFTPLCVRAAEFASVLIQESTTVKSVVLISALARRVSRLVSDLWKPFPLFVKALVS